MKLESHRFTRYFEPEQAAKISKIAIIKKFTPQEIVFEEGEISDSLFLVLEGEVEVSKKINESNNYVLITSIDSNGYFGELGIIDRKPRSARVISTKETTLAQIYYDSLREILSNTRGDIVLNILSILSQRLRAVTSEYAEQLVYKEKMALIGEMVNTIIHDFRSPFTGIQLSSSMLKELHPDVESQEWCDLIQIQVQRMLIMAEEVLAFSQGNTTLYSQQVNIGELLQKFEKLNQVYVQSRQVKLVVSVTDNLIIDADENKINRVLQNLLVNAVEAIEKSGGKIEIQAKRKEQWAEIRISDNGPGIPPEIHDKFFQPFVTHGKQGGIGLGTAIVKSIIDAHGGDISFESDPATGTIFYLCFPLVSID
ncbi:MAG: ATP-binding protein [Microcoleaceae cyanobacterium]